MHASEAPASGTRTQIAPRARDVLRASEHPCEGARAAAREHSECRRAREIAHGERRRARHREQGCGAVHADERQVGRRGGDQCRREHPAREVLLERHLEREHGTGRGGFEDRGDARGRAGDEEDAPVLFGEHAGSRRRTRSPMLAPR